MKIRESRVMSRKEQVRINHYNHHLCLFGENTTQNPRSPCSYNVARPYPLLIRAENR